MFIWGIAGYNDDKAEFGFVCYALDLLVTKQFIIITDSITMELHHNSLMNFFIFWYSMVLNTDHRFNPTVQHDIVMMQCCYVTWYMERHD